MDFAFLLIVLVALCLIFYPRQPHVVVHAPTPEVGEWLGTAYDAPTGAIYAPKCRLDSAGFMVLDGYEWVDGYKCRKVYDFDWQKFMSIGRGSGMDSHDMERLA